MSGTRHVAAAAALALLALASASRADVRSAIDAGDYEAALEEVESLLAERPDDPALSFQRARIHGFLGNDETSLAQLDELRQRYPDDVDYAFARGALLSRMGQGEAALIDLDHAAGIAPEYEAVWQLRYQVSSRYRAEELGIVREESADRFPAADWWRPTATTRTRHWTLTAGAAVDELSGDIPGWSEQFVDVRRALSDRNELRFRARRNSRYSATDTAFGAGLLYHLGGVWDASLDIDVADDPAFQPQLDASVRLSRSLGNGWNAGIGGRSREYSADRVHVLSGSLERYFRDYRLAYNVSLSRLNDASAQAGHALTFNWYYASYGSVGISVNTGSEAESIGDGRVLESEVWGAALSGHRDLSERVALRWWLGVHEQGDYYRRRFLGVAVTVGI